MAVQPEITTLQFRTSADDGSDWPNDGRDVMVPRYADDTFSTSVDGYYFELYYPGGGYTFGINFGPSDPSNTNVQITVTGEAVDIYKFTKAVRDAIDARSEFSATINEADTSGTAASATWVAVADSGGDLGGSYIMMSRPTGASLDTEFHYWWINVSGGDSDPAPAPANYPAITATGHEVAISTNDTAATVAGAFRSAMSAVSGFTASGSSDSITCTCDDKGPVDVDPNDIGGSWINTVTSYGVWNLYINTVTVTNVTAGAATDGNDGDFPDSAGTNNVDLLTVTVTQQGAGQISSQASAPVIEATIPAPRGVRIYKPAAVAVDATIPAPAIRQWIVTRPDPVVLEFDIFRLPTTKIVKPDPVAVDLTIPAVIAGLSTSPAAVSVDATVLTPGTHKARSTSPVAAEATIPAPNLQKSLGQTAVAIDATVPAVTTHKTRSATPVSLEAAVPAPSPLKAYSQTAVAAEATVPAPSTQKTVKPAAAALTATVTTPTTHKARSAVAVAIEALIPAPTVRKIVKPSPVQADATITAPAWSKTVRPSPVAVDATAVAPGLLKTRSMQPVAVDVSAPAAAPKKTYAQSTVTAAETTIPSVRVRKIATPAPLAVAVTLVAPTTDLTEGIERSRLLGATSARYFLRGDTDQEDV